MGKKHLFTAFTKGLLSAVSTQFHGCGWHLLFFDWSVVAWTLPSFLFLFSFSRCKWHHNLNILLSGFCTLQSAQFDTQTRSADCPHDGDKVIQKQSVPRSVLPTLLLKQHKGANLKQPWSAFLRSVA